MAGNKRSRSTWAGGRGRQSVAGAATALLVAAAVVVAPSASPLTGGAGGGKTLHTRAIDADAPVQGGCSTSGSTVSCDFPYAGAPSGFAVPESATDAATIQATLDGAGSYTTAGGQAVANFEEGGQPTLSPGEVLQVYVGGAPDGEQGGYEGGGNSQGGGVNGHGGGGGGGATALFDDDSTPLAIAGGAGGEGGEHESNNNGGNGGAGGSGSGAAGTSNSEAGGGGKGGAGGTGGAAGTGGGSSGAPGLSSSTGVSQGGDGGGGSSGAGGGGGGGSGGGGGGAAGGDLGSGGGGGGGGDYVNATYSPNGSVGVGDGAAYRANGSLLITYTRVAPTVAIAGPTTVGGQQQYTVTVSSPGLLPSGSVTLYGGPSSGATSLGTTSLSGGSASFDLAAGSTAPTSLTAVYTGDADVAPTTVTAGQTTTTIAPASGSTSLSPAGFTVAVGPSSGSPVSGASGTLVVTLTPQGGTATSPCGQANNVSTSSGSESFNCEGAVQPGTGYQIAATFTGTGTSLSSSATTSGIAPAVAPSMTTTFVDGNGAAVTTPEVGSSVDAMVTVSPPSGVTATPTGQVALYADNGQARSGSALCTAVLSAGTGSCDISSSTTGQHLYLAAYTPDSASNAAFTSATQSASAPSTLTWTTAPTTTHLSAKSTTPVPGTSVTLSATADVGSSASAGSDPVTQGSLAIYGVPANTTSCAAPAASWVALSTGPLGSGTQPMTTTVTAGALQTQAQYCAVYTQVSGGGYDSSASAVLTLTPTGESGTTVATSDSVVGTSTAGVTYAVTTTVTTPTAPVDDVPTASDLTMTVTPKSLVPTQACTSSVTGQTLTQVCDYLLTPGAVATWKASYADGLTVPAPGAVVTVTAPASSTVVTMGTLPSTITYGTPVTPSATVTPSSDVPVAGSLVVEDGQGNQVCAATPGASAPTTGAVTWTCPTVTTISSAAGSLHAVFTSADTAVVDSGSSAPVTVAVTPATVTLTPTWTADSQTTFTLTVAASSATPAVTPTGSIVIAGPGGAGCTAPIGSTGAADCTGLPLPAAGHTAVYTASFAPDSSGDFAAGGSASLAVERAVGGPCNAAFAALWAKVLASHTASLDGGALGSFSLTPTVSDLGQCDAAAILPFTATFSLYGGVLSTTSSGGTSNAVTGTATQSGGICLSAGDAIQVPADVSSDQMAVTSPLCFSLSSGGLPQAPTSGAIGLTDPGGAAAPLVSLPGGAPESLTFTVPTGSAGSLAVDLTPLPSASVNAPAINVAGTLAPAGEIDATAATTNVSLFGHPVSLTGTVDRPAGGSLDVQVDGELVPAGAGPIALATGATLTAGTATLHSAQGSGATLAVAATLSLGTATDPLTTTVSGTFSGAASWRLQATGSPSSAWSPLPGLTITPTLSGYLESDGTASPPTYSYDLIATGSPLATWTPTSKAAVTVSSVELASSAPAGTTCSATGSGPMLYLDGSVTIPQVAAQVSGCAALGSGSYALTGTAASLAEGPLTVTNPSVTISSNGQTTTVVGSGTYTITADGQPLTGTAQLSLDQGTLVIGAPVDLTPLGPPITGYLAYASGPVTSFDTGQASVGDDGVVSLAAGLTVQGELTLSSGIATTLSSAGFAVPAGGVIELTATIGATAADLSFTATLSGPSGLPFLDFPGGALDGAALTYGSGHVELDLTGTMTPPGAATAPVALALAFAADGSFTATGTVTDLAVLGATVDLTGSLTRSAAGTVSGALTGTVPGSIGLLSTPPVTLSGTEVSIGSGGLSVTGTLGAAGASITVSGTATSLAAFSLTASGAVKGWTPTPGLTVDATFSGLLTHTSSGTTFEVAAAPQAGSSSLATLTPAPGLSLAVSSFELGDAGVPTGCSIGSAGDLYLGISGSLDASLLGESGTGSVGGCADLTHPGLALDAAIPALSVSALGGKVTISGVTVQLTHAPGSGFSISATATLGVDLPSGGRLQDTGVMQFTSGGFVIGVRADLSSYFGAPANDAYLYYASVASSVATGDPVLGTLSLQPGVTVGLDLQVGASLSKGLSMVGFHTSTGTSLAATANIDLSKGTITLDAALSSGSATLLSEGTGTSLTLDQTALQLQIANGQLTFSVVASGDLHVPAAAPGGVAGDVAITGMISLGDSGLNLSLTATGWQDAFGISGLDVSQLAIEGGIGFSGVPSVGITATVAGLPGGLASAIGYEQGAPITMALAVSESSYLLDLTIGMQGSTEPALAPFAAFGRASLLSVNYAQLYISPTGATIGTAVFAPGYGLAFTGTIFGSSVQVDAQVDPTTPSLSFTGQIGTVDLGQLEVGPTTLTIDASPSNFDFEFAGEANIPNSTSYVGPDSRWTGSLSADVDIKVDTGGFSAHGDFDASVLNQNYLSTSTCKVLKPCDYQWVDGLNLSITLNNLGFAVSGGGLTIDIPNTSQSITFPWTAGGATTTADTGDGGAADGIVEATAVRSNQVRSWRPTGSLGAARTRAGTTTLPDGDVLVVGGESPSGGALSDVEVYDARTGRWQVLPPLHDARVDPSVVPLDDGAILVTGGQTATGPVLTSELLDPKTLRWQTTGSLVEPAGGATATLLGDGRVLLAGGLDGSAPSAATEVYDPQTGRWAAGIPLGTARVGAAAARLPDGKVLVAGGQGPGGPLRTAELYDPTTGQWAPTGAMGEPRSYASAAALPGGQVLVAGGASLAETYDPTTGTWAVAGNEPTAATWQALVVTSPRSVMAVGGLTATGAVASVSTYDPQTRSWSGAASLPVGRGGASGAVLAGGRILVAGGGASGDGASSAAFVLAPLGAEVPSGAFDAHPMLLGTTSGTIEGAVAGGLAAIALVIGGWLVRRRRQARS